MAEPLGPPLFREALVERGALTMTPSWQRWLVQLWQLSGTGGAGTPGPAGPTGPQGPTGPAGPAGTDATLGPTLTTIEALTGTANTMLYFTGTDVAALTALSAYARTLLDDGDAATARGTLGLGTMATQNASAVAITGGSGDFTGRINAFVGVSSLNYAGNNVSALYTNVMSAGGTGRYQLNIGGDAPSYFNGPVEFGSAATTRTNLGLGTAATQTYEEGTFTMTATGFSGTAPSGTARYVRVGKQVTMALPELGGTSNATTLSLTGIPSPLTVPLHRVVLDVQNNGVFQAGVLQSAGTTLNVYATPAFGAWTASGAKGIYPPHITYMLA